MEFDLVDTTDRNQQIIAAYRDGKTINSIAAEWGVSRQRINQLVRAAGVPHRHPGMAETKRLTARAG